MITLSMAAIVFVLALIISAVQAPARRARRARFVALAPFVVRVDGPARVVAPSLGGQLRVTARADGDVWLIERPGVAASVEVTDAGSGSMVAFIPDAGVLFRRTPTDDDRRVDTFRDDLRDGLRTTASGLVVIAGTYQVAT